MDLRTWDSAKALFLATADAMPEERVRLLQAPDIDPAVRELVYSMLDADARVGDAPPVAAVDRIDALEDSVDRRLEGARFGDYQIVRLIGRGGMGVVYLAERTREGATQRVALKLMRSVQADGDYLRRFQSERSLLARLDHPAIARLIDAGQVDGTPYYAMEYVDGEPLTTYCDRNRLDLRARLELMRQVCDAVAHAHRSLVVHRDVKPGNVLVDREGRPRLLDFGIAKKLAPLAPVGSDATATHGRFVSPHCTAPEVITGGNVTTACDTYALGALLYEVLCGVPALVFDSPSLAAIEHAIVNQPPTWPSERVGELPRETGARIARERGFSTIRALAAHLRGDLDTIVLRALAKEPRRRYPGADVLADELRRHLDDLPIQARPDSTAYRAGKFVRRHRWPVAVLATVVLAMLAIAVTAWRQSLLVAHERDAALAQRARAERVSNILIDTFANADPTHTLGDEISARQVLDQAMLRFDADRGEPVDSSVLVALAGAYAGLGQFERAETIARDALAAPAADTASIHRLLAEVLNARGRYDEALEHAQAAVIDGDPASRAPLAPILANLGRVAEAEAVYRHVLAHFEASNNAGPEAAEAARVLARHLRNNRKIEEARVLFERALAIQRATLPAHHPQIAETLAGLASVERTLGEFERAVSLARESLDIQRRVYGDEHPAVGKAWGALGNALEAADRHSEAAEAMTQALALVTRFHGEHSPMTAMMHYGLGRVLRVTGDVVAAELQFRAAIASTKGSGSTANLTFFMLGLAASLNAQSRATEAVAILEPLREQVVARDGLETINVAYVESELAEALRKLGRFDEAIRLLDHALPLMQTRLGAEDSATRNALARRQASAAASRAPLEPPTSTQGG